MGRWIAVGETEGKWREGRNPSAICCANATSPFAAFAENGKDLVT